MLAKKTPYAMTQNEVAEMQSPGSLAESDRGRGDGSREDSLQHVEAALQCPGSLAESEVVVAAANAEGERRRRHNIMMQRRVAE